MSADLDHLLTEASADPAAADPQSLWAAGRRRRRWLQAGGVASAAASIAVVGLVVVGLDPTPAPTVDPLAEGPETSEPTPMDAAGESTPPGDELPRFDAPFVEPATPDEEDVPAEEPDETAGESEADAAPSPQPDPAAVADPCAPHQGREMDGFLDVVAPVAGQSVSGTVDLVGCSNVPEANVRYRIVDAGGTVLVDHFTTATCGTGCVGEFRETVSVPTTGAVTVQVFWESPQDGSEMDMTQVPVTAG